MKNIFTFLLTALLQISYAQEEAWRNNYDYVMDFNEGLAEVSKDRQRGFVNEKGNLVIPLQFDEASWFESGLCIVKKNDLWGIIDKKGKLVIPYKYNEISHLSEGCFRVQDAVTGKYGFINKADKVVVPLKYSGAASAFSDGLVIVYQQEQGVGFVNAQGKEQIPLQYHQAHPFNQGAAPVRKGDKWGFINKKNQPLSEFQYAEANPFIQGLSVVKHNGRYGFVDTQGKEVIPLMYENARSFSQGLAAVKKDGRWGYIDLTGKLQIPFAYSSVGDFDEEGTTYAALYDAVFIIDKMGTCVRDCQQLEKNTSQKPKKEWQARYEFIGQTIAGVTIVGKDAQQGVVNKQGKEIISPQYSSISIVRSLLFVNRDGKEGVFDLKGNVIVPPVYDMLQIEYFDKDDPKSDFVFFTRRDLYFGLLNKEGKTIVPEDFYSNIETNFMDKGTIRVFKNGKVGMYSTTGQQILPILFDRVEPFVYQMNESEVTYQGKSFYISKTGKCTRDCENAPAELLNTQPTAEAPAPEAPAPAKSNNLLLPKNSP